MADEDERREPAVTQYRGRRGVVDRKNGEELLLIPVASGSHPLANARGVSPITPLALRVSTMALVFL